MLHNSKCFIHVKLANFDGKSLVNPWSIKGGLCHPLNYKIGCCAHQTLWNQTFSSLEWFCIRFCLCGAKLAWFGHVGAWACLSAGGACSSSHRPSLVPTLRRRSSAPSLLWPVAAFCSDGDCLLLSTAVLTLPLATLRSSATTLADVCAVLLCCLLLYSHMGSPQVPAAS